MNIRNYFCLIPRSVIEPAGQHRFATGLVPGGQSLKPCCPALAQVTHYADLVQLGRVYGLPYRIRTLATDGQDDVAEAIRTGILLMTSNLSLRA